MGWSKRQRPGEEDRYYPPEVQEENPDVWPGLTSGSCGRGLGRDEISRYFRREEAERCYGYGGGLLGRTRRSEEAGLGKRSKMAAAQAVEEMRSRVVLGEFGVRNVSLVAWRLRGRLRPEQGWLGWGLE